MAFLIVGGTLIAAALFARHVLVIGLIPEWSVGFAGVFIGARFKKLLIRAAVLAISLAAAWVVILAVLPFHLVPSVDATLSEVSELRITITGGIVWGLLLASLAEAIQFLSARIAGPSGN